MKLIKDKTRYYRHNLVLINLYTMKNSMHNKYPLQGMALSMDKELHKVWNKVHISNMQLYKIIMRKKKFQQHRQLLCKIIWMFYKPTEVKQESLRGTEQQVELLYTQHLN
jgi:hypothetical protein